MEKQQATRDPPNEDSVREDLGQLSLSSRKKKGKHPKRPPLEGGLSLSDPGNLRCPPSRIPVSRDRSGSDPRSPPLQLSEGLRAKHASHKCRRPGSSQLRSGSDPATSPSVSGLRRSPCSPSSADTLSEGSFPSSRRSSESHHTWSPSLHSHKAKDRPKYEAYMPLCEVQQALRKGQVVEGVLRINPRNYEDSFISAPDSQMDIYVGGLPDRNRALNGDVVAVQLKPQHQWKIHWDKVQLWEQQSGKSVLDVLGVEEEEEEDEEVEGSNWDGSSPLDGGTRPSDTIEVLGIERLLGQVQQYVDQQRRSKHHVPMPCSMEASLGVPQETIVEEEVPTLDPLDPWAQTADAGTAMVFSPEELLEVPEGELEAGWLNGAVAPDELSEDELSTGSTELEQHLEDLAFLRASQDARNNNCLQEGVVVLAPPEHAVQPLPPPPLSPPRGAASGGDGGRGKKKKKNKKKQPSKVPSESSSTSHTTASLRKQSPYERLTIADVLRHPQWRRFVQKTGKVVCILEAKNTRITAGHLRLQQDRNPSWVLFSPRDSRFPRMLIPSSECPPGFFQRPGDFSNTLFLAQMTKWLPDATFAQGQLKRLIGQAGDLSAETEAILESHQIDHGEFPDGIMGSLDVGPNWKVPEALLSERRDFRKEMVFTIDPKTARDLDDALSCRRLDGTDLWEVGVHIADVSHFVEKGTKLDQVAKHRATSVYLVQQVIPMLPRLLCDHLCSLHPGEDKLTFSVVWKMNKEGRVFDEWFGRSVIRSCCKLSYEHAQELMDRTEGWELPTLHDGHTAEELHEAIGVLKEMTTSMRQRRKEGGALSLDQVTLSFSLNEDFYPVGFSVYEHTHSHRLVEELMLLANMAVAHRLYRQFPEQALLRSHPPPDEAQLTEVVALCEAHGVHLDASSAGSLQTSLNAVIGEDETSHAKLNVLTHLLAKPMKMAVYFCAGQREDPCTFYHYALSVPLYTHFTSPIRRYADIMVHRLLAAALGYTGPPKETPKELQAVADHCNDNKFKARVVQELSCEMFLYVFIRQGGKFEDRAIVSGVLEHAFDVLSLSVGMVKRVYCDKLGAKSFSHSSDGGRQSIEVRYQGTKGEDVVEHIEVFKLVDVVITANPNEPLKYQVVLKPPPDTVPVIVKKDEKTKGRQSTEQKQ